MKLPLSSKDPTSESFLSLMGVNAFDPQWKWDFLSDRINSTAMTLFDWTFVDALRDRPHQIQTSQRAGSWNKTVIAAGRRVRRSASPRKTIQERSIDKKTPIGSAMPVSLGKSNA